MTPKQQMIMDYIDGKITNVEIIEAWDRQREQNKRYREALWHIKENSDDKIAVFISRKALEGEE